MKNTVKDGEESIELLITVDEAARRLSIGRSHIYHQIRRGALRSVRIGRSRRVLEGDLDAFINGLLDRGDSCGIPPPKPPVNTLLLRPGRR